jgi:hypothetical protein
MYRIHRRRDGWSWVDGLEALVVESASRHGEARIDSLRLYLAHARWHSEVA